jgi:hypothetical protein
MIETKKFDHFSAHILMYMGHKDKKPRMAFPQMTLHHFFLLFLLYMVFMVFLVFLVF